MGVPFNGGYPGIYKVIYRIWGSQNWGVPYWGPPYLGKLPRFHGASGLTGLVSHEIPSLPSGVTRNVQGFFKDSVVVVLGPLLSRSGGV